MRDSLSDSADGGAGSDLADRISRRSDGDPRASGRAVFLTDHRCDGAVARDFSPGSAGEGAGSVSQRILNRGGVIDHIDKEVGLELGQLNCHMSEDSYGSPRRLISQTFVDQSELLRRLQ